MCILGYSKGMERSV
ncbi:hypothetical protein LINPERPRIM_LOCUS38602 [Linum perenne]